MKRWVFRVALTGLLVSTAVVARSQVARPAEPPRADVRVVITSPKAGEYLNGPTRLAADISPSADVGSANFFIDGAEVCVLTAEPFSCNWDAGRTVRERQVRLTVTLKSGIRLPAQILWTGGLEYVDISEVEGVQVTVTVTNDGKFVQGLQRSAFRLWKMAGRRPSAALFPKMFLSNLSSRSTLVAA